MSKMLKIYADKADLPAISEVATILQKYDAFVLAEVADEVAKSLSRKYPVEDITSQYEVRFGDIAVDTSKPRITADGETHSHQAYAGATDPGAGPHHYVVQFIGPVKENWLRRLKATGAKVRSSSGGFSCIVRATKPMLPLIAALAFVRWVGHLPSSARIAPLTLGVGDTALPPRRRQREGTYTIEVFDPEHAGPVARSARKLGFQILAQEPSANLLVVKTTGTPAEVQSRIHALSAVHGVRYIRQRVTPRTANNIATKVMGNAWVALDPAGLKLTGDGEIVAVCDTGLDTGDPATIHPDFKDRIVAINSYPISPDFNSQITNPGADDGPADLDSGHGTHVSGSVLGNGAASVTDAVSIKGHANKARLVFQAIEQEMKWKPSVPLRDQERYVLSGIPVDLKSLFQYAWDKGARIHSNSWGGGDPGAYDQTCFQFDQFVWEHKSFCPVIAAGNDGSDHNKDGKIDLGSVTSPGTAKNCITVGACENLRPEFNAERYGDWWPDDFPVAPLKGDSMADSPDQVVAFSSRGPTADNRIKPDLLAPGTFILSTRSTRLAPNNFAWKAYPTNKKYFYMGGTSMATPLVSGAAALVREFLRTRRGLPDPSAALVKACLIAGAQRVPKVTTAKVLLDPHQGFGRLNLDRSFRKSLATVEGPALKTGQKKTTAIVVPPGAATLRIAMCYSDFPGPALVNNLNLIVTAPNGKRFVGNGPVSPGAALTLDTANNVEVVEVPAAVAGTWNVDVVAGNVPSGPQDFALAAVLV